MAVSPAEIFQRANALAERMRRGLRDIPGCRIRDVPEAFDAMEAARLGASRCAIVTVDAAERGVTSSALRDALDGRGIGVSVSPRYHSFNPRDHERPPVLRISPTYFNSEAEVDAALEAIEEEIRRLAA